jgi:hypothetical protein
VGLRLTREDECEYVFGQLARRGSGVDPKAFGGRPVLVLDLADYAAPKALALTAQSEPSVVLAAVAEHALNLHKGRAVDCQLSQPRAQWLFGDCLDNHRPALLKLFDHRELKGPTRPPLRAGETPAGQSPGQRFDQTPEAAGLQTKPRRVARQAHCSQPWSELPHEQRLAHTGQPRHQNQQWGTRATPPG